MSESFFKRPILNSPYEYPSKHWELDDDGQPTHKTLPFRRESKLITPIPKAKKRKDGSKQGRLAFDEIEGLSNEEIQYDPTPVINGLRKVVDEWRALSNSADWQVTPETARLLKHWRHHKFMGYRPFFCQVEAVETLIWLTEVAPNAGKKGKQFLDHIKGANEDANPELLRIALKLATGAGKTTVMAMIIAWQTINALRRPNSDRFTRGFLIVAPGITIKDRLRVLQPNDPDSYYKSRELVPLDMMQDLERARIVITNYHAFKLRERFEVSRAGRSLLQGQRGEDIKTLETEGQMIQRVMPELMSLKKVMVINDEAHHCYREKPVDSDAEIDRLKGDDKQEAKKNNEAARLWISGIEMVKRRIGPTKVIDLSATPFFLRGSGYAEGTLFPWTMSDFSLMDAIECGIVKLPRVPIADNLPGQDLPVNRDLWRHIGKDLPKKGRGSGKSLDPESIPLKLQTALEALYGHYKKTFEVWQKSGIRVPPCFIIVCNNTATSKLVYDYVSGYEKETDDGHMPVEGKLELFRNFNEHGHPFPQPRTLLIDSEQLESGEALDDNFRKMNARALDLFKREMVERTGNAQAADKLTDQEVLREVMNTVGKEGRLGASIRCVVSVSMLTEGWDANNVTHVLGVRAFGTQLLCEQVIGRALRRQSYELNEEGRFEAEYADVFGIPFDFAAKPHVQPPQPPPDTVRVKAVRPDRDHLEISFPNVAGYRTEIPQDRLTASFTADSELVLTTKIVSATNTQNSGIIGEQETLTVEHLKDTRKSTLIFHLAVYLMNNKYREQGQDPPTHLFSQLKRITKEWLDNYLVCKSDTWPAQLLYRELAEMACNKIMAAINQSETQKGRKIVAILSPFNPKSSSRFVNFSTSKKDRWESSPERCHVNWVILDSDWEAEFCRVAEAHPKVLAYVKNHNLGLEVPYLFGSKKRTYLPDFIVQIDDGHGPENPLNLIVEIKGYRGEDAKEKKLTMDTYWVPGVNNLGEFGRWAFAEFRDVYTIESDFKEKVESFFDEMVS
ncbi:MAG: DEAD/DEAH box helicase family protein, partial [Candidatus Cyclonatronum sp.]|uniref:BPTD_3080 family restriction endonuclease n=1 Tax=Cyclonatronum sp. TaxID=3024185 RepID=UPI0025BFA26C